MKPRHAPPSMSLRRYASLHAGALQGSLQRLLARPIGSLLTAAVLAVALALPLALLMVLHEAERFSSGIHDSRELAVFLRPELGQEAAAAWAERLAAEPVVAAVEARSPAQGLQELSAMRELGDALAVLDTNPLPWVLVVTPRPGADDHALAERLRSEAEIDYVQHDAAWRARLDAWLGLGRRLVLVLGIALALAGLIIVGNTVRLDIRARSEEIAVLRLLGANRAYIRRPFLYLGASYGLLAAALAMLFAWAALHALEPAVHALAATYGGHFALAGMTWQEVWPTVVAACTLGVLGAHLAVGHYLRQSEVA